MRLRASGAEAVVCWRTATLDDAARLFAVEFFRALAAYSSAPPASEGGGGVAGGGGSDVETGCEGLTGHHLAAAAAVTASTSTHDPCPRAPPSDVCECERAFDAAVAAVRAARRRFSGKLKYELSDPGEVAGSSKQRYPRAAGVPVLLCEGSVGEPGVRLPQPLCVPSI